MTNYKQLCNNVTSVLVVDRDVVKDTQRWSQIYVRSRQQTCLFFFMPQKYLNKPFELLRQIDYIFPFVCAVIDHRWRYIVQRTKIYYTRRSRVAWLLFFTRCDVFCDLLQYHTQGKYNPIFLYNKNSNGLLEDVWGMKKEKRDLTWIWRHLCVYPLVDHFQQPMEMHTEVTLLYNTVYTRAENVIYLLNS